MALIAHLADTHLGYAQYRLSEREEDTYELFTNAYEIAIRERVSAVVISGDVFHSPRPPNRALLVFARTVRRAGEKGVVTLAVAGEHDHVRKRGEISPLVLISQLSSDVRFIGKQDIESVREKIAIESNGIKLKFYGINALPRITDRVERYVQLFKVIESDAMREDGKKVLVAHLPVEGLMASAIEPSVPISTLPKGIDYYAFGHLHIRHFARAGESGYLGYPGSLDILSKQEIEEWRSKGKGMYIVDLSGDEPSLSKIDLGVRPQLIIDEDNAAALLKRVEELTSRPWDKKPILHIVARLSREEEKAFRTQLDKLLYGKVLDYRLEIHKKGLGIGLSSMAYGETPNEASIISGVYGIDIKTALAIVKLKDCLSSRPKPVECENEIRDVLAFKDELLKLSEARLHG